MKHPLSSPAGHVRRRYNGNAPPPGVPLRAVPLPDPHIGLPGTLRDDPETSQTSHKRVADVDPRRGECGERRARPESETRGLGVDARRSSGTGSGSAGAPRACLVCASTVVSTSGDVARR